MAAEDKVIGVVLTQETEDKGHIITYISQRRIHPETRYTFIKRLFDSILCLYQVEALFTI